MEVIALATMNPSLCVAVPGDHAANLDGLQLPPADTVPDRSAFLCLFDHLKREDGGDNPVCCWLTRLEKVSCYNNPGRERSDFDNKPAGRNTGKRKEPRKKEQTDRDNSAPKARTRR